MKYGDRFKLTCGNVAAVTGVYAIGFHYHNLDKNGDCIVSERYMTHNNYMTMYA